MRRYITLLLMICALLGLSTCGARPEAEPSGTPAQRETASAEAPAPPHVTAVPDPYPPGARPAADEPTAEPAPTPEPTATPVPTPAPMRAGTYEGSDGSVLVVNADGTCTYETELSGTVNGKRMSGRVTFHGTAEDGAFSFTRVTYFGLDLTELARAAGYSDASVWERAAAVIYAGGQ